MPKLCEAWATGCLGFCGWEENRAGRTPRPEGSRHEHGRAEHALRGTQCLEGGVKRRRAKGVYVEALAET